MKKHPPTLAISRARQLRRNMTDAERIMWALLRENFPDWRFRRQVPLASYIADFASHRAKLVVGLDGGHHGGPDHARRDAERDRLIGEEGYRVVRLWNSDVVDNRDGCLERLALILAARPSPAAGPR